LRKAFNDLLNDPEFLAESKRAKLEIDPVSGDEMESGFMGFYEMQPQTLERLKQILVPER